MFMFNYEAGTNPNYDAYINDLEVLQRGGYEKFEVEGIDCVMYRHPLGHLNGYIHYDGKCDYDHYSNIDVHGGLTYSGRLEFVHPSLKGQWLGFDCNHYMDWSPSCTIGDATYKDTSYVKEEIKSLAKQYKKLYQ